jgi:hypothetical protein
MNAAKRKQKPGPFDRFRAPLQPLLTGTGRRVTIGVFLICALLGGIYFGWQRWGERIADQPEYVVLPENIDITPPPPWIRSDVKLEALRAGDLTELSLLDRELTIKIARAFGMHNWVQDVVRVSKHHPARVEVQLEYRRPVAMVEVVVNNQPGLLPIDVQGILLPPGDFSAEQARDYLRISVPDATPAGPVGTPWGAPRIHGAARIAAVLQDHWKKLGLYRIVQMPTEAASGRPRYLLATRHGAQIVWGPAPEPDDEAEARSAMAKVAHLLAFVEANGPLDTAGQSTNIDLTSRESAHAGDAHLISTPGRPAER